MYRLIIVEDEAETRKGLCNYFPWENLNFKIVGSLENGLKALDFINDNMVHAILCDIKMPEMSGIELAKKLYQQKSKIKIVLLSSYCEFEYAQSAIEYNVRYYLSKPTNYEKLVEVFTRLGEELDYEAKIKARYSSSDTSENRGNYYESLIKKIKEFISKNYRTATLKSTANHICMNPYYLSSFFKQHTGEMFSEYVIKTKMQIASKMLLNPDMKIYLVCDSVGYSSANNFSRTFKAYFGMSPSEYRSSNGIDC